MSKTSNITNLLKVITRLEVNGWTGLDENGMTIEWDGWNLENCSKQEWYGRRYLDHCSMDERREIMASELSLMHVYFKEPHLRKYTRDENVGPVDVIGNYMLPP